MNTRCALALTIPLLLLVPQAAAADNDHAPSTVVAQGVSGVLVVVAWTAGDAPADAYRVYAGEFGGALQPIATVDADTFSFATTAEYGRFAVTGMRNGDETEPVLAISGPCVRLKLTTPPSSDTDIPDCLPGLLPTDKVDYAAWLP